MQKEVNREYRAVKSKKGKRAFNCMFWAFFRGFVQGEAELDEKGKEEEERHEWRRRFSGKNNAKKGAFWRFIGWIWKKRVILEGG